MTETSAQLYTVETTGPWWRRVHNIRPVLSQLTEQLQGLPGDEARALAASVGYDAGAAARELNHGRDRRLDASKGAVVGSFALGEIFGPGVETAYAIGVICGVWGDELPAAIPQTRPPDDGTQAHP